MNKKLISAVITATLLATSSLPAMAKEIQYTNNKTDSFDKQKPDKSDEAIVQSQISKAILEQGVTNEKTEKVVELLLVCEGNDVTEKLENLGAEVNKMSTSVYVINISANRAKDISNIREVKSVGRDRMLQLPKPIELEEIEGQDGGIADPKLEYCHESVGMTKFWRAGFDGKGTKVAIIDTGVEPRNEMLTLTTDGKIKIVDYQDFWKNYNDFSEGDVKLSEKEVKVVDGKKYIEDGSTKIYLPDNTSDKVMFGYFLESGVYRKDANTGAKIPHDLNNNGKSSDKFPVVVMNYSDDDKSNDKIFVDTNADNTFVDEKEMGIYKEMVQPVADKVIFEMNEDTKKPVLQDGKPIVKSEYVDLYSKLVNNFVNAGKGKNPVGAEYNFVVTEVENRVIRDGSKQWVVNLGYDGNDHGTHVAGDAAGNGYEVFPFVDTSLKDEGGNQITDGTLKGAAPGAQVMACRVFQSNGGTPQSAYMAAMEYACENGADTLNMSLGSLPDLNDQSEPSVFLANELSKKYGTIFAISAGNEGPVTNSIGTPGTSEWAVTVGAYNSAWSNYGYPTIDDNMWYFSSNGPTEDGRLKPTIVAPGSQISSYPMWIANPIRGTGSYLGHGLMQGTSMASPYTAGVLAALKQAINEKDIAYHPLVVKEAIFETGNKDLNNEVYLPAEIGGGMIDPSAALKHLEGLMTNGLTQESLKQDGTYVDRNDIVLKTNFNYTEKLSYKPEGLYVRSGNIPSEVEVTITNTKDKEVNVNLVKDSYNENKYKTEWLTLPQDTLKLAAGEAKALTLKIDKSKLNQGVNSLIIKMDDPNTALQEGFIPVTVVNYLDLNISSPVLTESASREFGLQEWDKHFIKIPHGAEKVKITIERNDASDLSNVVPIIAEPSGIEREDLGWTTIPNVGKQEIVLQNPIAGTWEVALYATGNSLKDYGKDAATNAKGKHTVKAEMMGVIFEPGVVSYEGKAGEYLEKELAMKVLNVTENDTTVINLKATGLIGENTNIVEERKTIADQGHEIVQFNIPENDPNIVARFHTRNPKFANDDIDLELYEVTAAGNLGTMIASSGHANSDEDIYLESLKAGNYALAIIAYGTAATTDYDFIMQVANSSHGEKVIEVKNPTITLNRDIANISAGLKLPSVPGVHKGFILATDEEGNPVGKLKVEAVATGIATGIVVQSGNTPKEVKLGEDAKIEINAINYTTKDQEATLIFAIYEKATNKFIGYAKDGKNVKAGEKVTLSTTFKMPAEGDYIVKCFVWDAIEGQKPLSQVFEISVVK